MPTAKRATLIGATGLIGSHLLQGLERDDNFTSIRLLVRRPFTASHFKTGTYLLDFADKDAFRTGISNSDVIFCAIGTTQQKVGGDKEAYRRVDYDIAVNAARFCKETGCTTFVLVSSVGANAASNNFYLKLKGEIEEAIQSIGIPSVSFMRPSMLLGNRKEKRIGERIGKILMQAFRLALPAKYKPIEAKEVAAAMIGAAKRNKIGVQVYEYSAMKRLAANAHL